MRRLRLGTTRARLTILSVALLAIAALVADGGLYSVAVISTANASDAALRHQADVISAGLRLTDQGATYLGGDLPTQAADGLATDVSVVSDNGLMTTTTGNPLRSATLEALAAPVLKTGRPIWVDITDSAHAQRRVYVTLVRTVDPNVALIVERSVAAQNSSLGWIRALMVILSLLFVSLGGLVAYWQAGRALKPVREISGLARSLSEHNLHRRVDIPVPDDELGDLARTFNDMLARLEISFETMSRFIADASHELRGPLTHMRSEIELARSGGPNRHDTMDTLGELQAEVAHMSDMVDKLLLLARADAGVLRPARRELDVADLVHETAARWSSRASGAGVRLGVEAPESGTVKADPTLTRRILDNLIENAIRHSPARGQISLRASRTDGRWLFEVADEGMGVPLEERGKIFDRFARGDNARTRSGLGGTGLGLAVSETLARVQDAELKLAWDARPGAIFQLTFPADGVRPKARRPAV
jgi:signal transduction histidine kinase